ncbi:MAG: hypothetical protein ACJ8F7_00130 [Gemmataceae bacterium]
MFVEIRREGRIQGEAVRVRQFGTGHPEEGNLVPPGGQDDALTHLSYNELLRLADGVWEFPTDSKP